MNLPYRQAPEFKQDLETVDAELIAKLGRRPSNTERAKALHINRDTLYTWLGKVDDYERAQGLHLKAVGE